MRNSARRGASPELRKALGEPLRDCPVNPGMRNVPPSAISDFANRDSKVESSGKASSDKTALTALTALTAFAALILCPITLRSEQNNAPVMDPEVRQAFDNGLLKFRAGQFEEAKQSFSRVTELLPNYSGGWINLGSAEYRLGEYDDAEKHLRKAVHLDPDVTQAWLTLGIIAYQKGELEAGFAALSQAVYLEPDNSHAHMYLGVLARKRGWLDAAEDELRKAVELDDSYAEAHFNLAMVYTEREPPSIELARRHYYRALALGAPADADLDRLLKKALITP